MTEDDAHLDCPGCRATNRVAVQPAVRDPRSVRCGRCGRALLLVRGEPLPGLDGDALAHPWDREALSALRRIPYADRLLSQGLERTVDRLARFRYLAGAVRIDERQGHALHALYREAAGRIDVDPPPLYLIQSPEVNASTLGAAAPMVIATSGLVDALEDRELVGVLGHELTHVKLNHALYRTLVFMLSRGGLGVLDRLLGLGKLLATPLRMSLMRWYQMAELSADRGELVATGSLEAAVRAHMMLAGGSRRIADQLDVEAFVDQAREAEAQREQDLLVGALEMLDTAQRTHPLPAWRVHQLVDWARSGAFLHLVAARADRPALEDTSASEAEQPDP